MEILSRLPSRECFRLLNLVLAAALLSGCSWELRGPKSKWLVGVWVDDSGRSTDGVEIAIALNRNWWLDVSARNPSACRTNPQCGPYARYEWSLDGNSSGVEVGFTPADHWYMWQIK